MFFEFLIRFSMCSNLFPILYNVVNLLNLKEITAICSSVHKIFIKLCLPFLTESGEMSCEVWSDATTAKGRRRLSAKRQKLGRGMEQSPPSPQKKLTLLTIPLLWTSSFQNFEIIYFCYFMSLHLWYFAMAALGN